MSRSRSGLLGCVVLSLVLSGCVAGSTAKKELGSEVVPTLTLTPTVAEVKVSDGELSNEIDDMDKEIENIKSTDFDEGALDDTKIIDGI